MNRIVQLMCIILIFALLSTLTVFAVPAPNIGVERSYIKISGTVSNSQSSSGEVTLIILKDNIKADEYKNKPDLAKCLYIWQTEADENGAYEFIVSFDDDDVFGEYVVMTDWGADEGTECVYVHKLAAQREREEVIELLNNSVNYGTVRDILEDNEEILQIKGLYVSGTLLDIVKLLFPNIKKLADDNFLSYFKSAVAEVNKKQQKEISDNGYSRDVKTSNVTISDTISANNENTETNEIMIYYTDVPKSHWAYEAVCYLAKAGVVNGVGDKLYMPEQSVTREQFVKMAALAFGFSSNSRTQIFNDVNFSDWFYPYVTAMSQNGIVNGIDDKLFGTGLNITRQDTAVIINNCLLKQDILSGSISAPVFKDKADIADYALNAILELGRYGIINGNENGCFMPLENITRAEVAEIIYKAKNIANLK